MGTGSNTDYYDRPEVVAAFYEARGRGLRERERRAVDAHFDPGGRLLDLGCGAGRTSAALAAEGFDVVGLDTSRPMLSLAADADPDVAYLVGDASALPFPDGSFPQVLFSYNGIDELRPESARVAALREAYRVLEPGGRFAFSSHNLFRWLLPVPPTRYWLTKMRRFWRRNARQGNLGGPYKTIDEGVTVHVGDPLSLLRRIRAVGFDVLDLVGTARPGSTLVGSCTFVVARKPKPSLTPD